MKYLRDKIHFLLRWNGLLFQSFFFLFVICCISLLTYSTNAANVEDSYFGIKFINVSDDFNFELSKNDSAFTRVYFSSKTDKFAFIVYATRGNLNHSITDKYDSILLSKYYKKPEFSKAIEEYGMKGFRNTYRYKYFNKEEKKYVDEFLTYDILYKPYNKNEEYFYLIYSYTITENDSRVDYFRSLMQIEPPKLSFWKTTFGLILTIVLYIILGFGLILFGRYILRKPYYDIKNGKIILDGIRKKNQYYHDLKKEFLKLEPNADDTLFKRYIDKSYIPAVSKMSRTAILTISLGLISLIIANAVVLIIVSHDISGLTILGFFGGELALIIGGIFLKIESILGVIWDAISPF